MEKDIIGFWGYPDPDVLENTKKQYSNAQFIDLDINYNYPQTKSTPETYCTIIKNIFNNAHYLKNRIIKILAPIGKDKCDSAYFVSEILKEQGFDIIQTSYEKKCPHSIESLVLPICKSNLLLEDKINLITKNIVEKKDYSFLPQIEPRFGFWGVPPNDFSILELFPKETEVFGWTRAVEAGYPGDWELETYVKRDLPTIFFTQAFCSKTLVASKLAQEHNGLFIDVDAMSTNSIKAKIEAFIKLR